MKMIKKFILAAFLSGLSAVCSFAGEDIKNEYWSRKDDARESLKFENYFFCEDGTFRYVWGCSGKECYRGWRSGTYFYDSAKNKIIFHATDGGDIGMSKKAGGSAPAEFILLEFLGKDSVRIDTDASGKNNGVFSNAVMKRHLGRIAEQTWTRADYSGISEILFDPLGNCLFREGKRGAAPDYQYECEYNIIGDILFLKVKSASVKKINSAETDNIKYEPEIKTYIRLGKSENGEIKVENVKIGAILGGGREWEREKGEYKVKNKLPEPKRKDLFIYKIEKCAAGGICPFSGSGGGEVAVY